MDILSNSSGLNTVKTKEFGKFPIKKTARKERGAGKNACPTIQLF